MTHVEALDWYNMMGTMALGPEWDNFEKRNIMRDILYRVCGEVEPDFSLWAHIGDVLKECDEADCAMIISTVTLLFE